MAEAGVRADDEEEVRHNFVGNKTETALLRMIEEDFADQCEKHYTDIRDEAEVVWMAPFSSDRKAMATCIKRMDGDGYRLHVKGAAEVIVDLCKKRVRLEDDEKAGGDDDSEDLPTSDIDEGEVKHIQNLIARYASRSLRTIALAYRDYEEWPPSGGGQGDKVKYDDVADDLTLLAISGIEDPLREGVKEAVQKCQKAGVHIIMCTGDNLLTAKSAHLLLPRTQLTFFRRRAIAQQCGIYTDGEAISGKEWRALSDEEKREKAPKLQVMARSLPQDKQTLTNSLKDSGRIVGVTGDGTNDALALKDGDVGFSMGQAGTEVAKEASDVIIMDDNVSLYCRGPKSSLQCVAVHKHRIGYRMGKMRQRCRAKIPSIPAGSQRHCDHHHIRFLGDWWRREQRNECGTIALGQFDHGHFRCVSARNGSS